MLHESGDGDIAGVIHTTDPEETGIDIYFGVGGAPEGVLAAAALRCVGGQIQTRLYPMKDADYKVPIEKCDALAGDAKSSCVAAAKAKFGKS